MNIDNIRNDFPTLSELTYLDTAFVGLFPRIVRAGYNEFLDKWTYFKVDKSRTILSDWLERTEEVRDRVASLLRASPEEIAFTQCTGSGLNIAINGMNWKKGDNVVFPELEHNSLITSVLKKKGVEARPVKSINGRVELNDIEKAVDNKTKLVQVSQVSYINGFRFDLKSVSDIAHKNGAKVLVDATQAVGALVTDVKKEDVDFLSAATYKYLIGPAGLAFLYVKPELIEELIPDRTGWKNQIWREGPRKLPEGARRFEYGTLNFQGIYALKNSLIYLNKLGLEAIERRNLELSNYLWSRLNDIGAKIYTPTNTSSHIISFFAKNAREISTTLMEEKVKITAREAHSEHIRVSPHFYNTMEDIDLLIEKLEKIILKNPNVFEA